MLITTVFHNEFHETMMYYLKKYSPFYLFLLLISFTYFFYMLFLYYLDTGISFDLTDLVREKMVTASS